MRTWVEKLGNELVKNSISVDANMVALRGRRFYVRKLSVPDDGFCLNILDHNIPDIYGYTSIKIYEDEYDYLKTRIDSKYEEIKQELIKEFESYE